jgi:hypothetical protein
MAHCVDLPRLDLARRNFASAVIGAGNRVFAIYQVDTEGPPFWVVEMDAATNYAKPLRPALKYCSHIDAITCLSDCARAALGDGTAARAADSVRRVAETA